MEYRPTTFKQKNMRECDTLSSRIYNLVIGGILLWGFFINLLMCKFLTPIFMEWNITAIIIGYLIVAFIGIMISKASSNPFISFIGYNMVVVPVGVVLSIAISDVSYFSIMHAIQITLFFTLAVTIISSIYPNLFLSLGRVIPICLFIVIVIEYIMLLFGRIMPTIWDTLVAAFFCIYIGFDWAEAQQNPHNLDNAVDACVSLYLDIINVFLRVLSNSGSKGNRD